jgi:hypothetical protein
MARQKYLLSNIYYNHMVLSEEQRQALRERMVLARQAKVAKANHKNGVQQAPDAVPADPAAPAAPVIAPVATPPPKKVKMPVADLDEAQPQATPRAQAKPQAEKQKFAKLVFYKEPTAKAQKKLAKIMNDESSDDEPAAPAAPAAPVAAPIQQKTEADYRQERYEKMKKLANQFF